MSNKDSLKSRIDDLKSKTCYQERMQAKHGSIFNANYKKKSTNKSGSGINILADILAGIAIGVFVGYYVDLYFGTMPAFLFIFTILGLFAGIYNISRY